MPLTTDAELAEYSKTYGPIRLGCSTCDREDYDGVHLLPGGWEGIYEVQSLRDSLSVYDDDEDAPRGYSSLDWYTHMGTCPECCVDEEVRFIKVMR